VTEASLREAAANERGYTQWVDDINTDDRVGIGTSTPAARLHVADGQVVISTPGNGNALLTLGSERSWVFKQTGSGAITALAYRCGSQ
jgi:hypothetical protein